MIENVCRECERKLGWKISPSEYVRRIKLECPTKKVVTMAMGTCVQEVLCLNLDPVFRLVSLSDECWDGA